MYAKKEENGTSLFQAARWQILTQPYSQSQNQLPTDQTGDNLGTKIKILMDYNQIQKTMSPFKYK